MSQLQPKRTKYRYQHQGHNGGIAWRGCDVSFGEWGLMATESGRVSSRQIEAGRMAITRYVKREGRLWIRIFPDKPISKKPLEVRMGSGKGAVESWAAVIKPGRVLYELGGVDEKMAKQAFRLASSKLPISTRVLQRGAE